MGDQARNEPGPTSASPQLVLSRKATAAAWARLGAEFGMLTDEEVTNRLGIAGTYRQGSAVKRAGLLGVYRDGEYRYPGYQFDDHGTVLPVIQPLLELARQNGWDDASVALWLIGPITSFDGEDRPVDHLREDQALLAVARNSFEAEW
ncbi:hypothetical protein E3T61_03145 [Cryobacterium lactosi]|uniref:Uncharacterized protein n=2 Tax=Cryobacterium lactosi TaxID=1259202 RepID=A0A4R9C0F7_9MICO|nr:hypothetical protein E3T61_03145 [Cryobacterium lactosi]